MGARLFSQINQSQVLSEFLQMLVSPLWRSSETSAGLHRIFVSFSHRDERWFERLKVHLTPLEKSGKIDLWSDQQIRPGSDWRREIDSALEQAQSAIMLISPDFLASDFIQSVEVVSLLEAARSRGARILPIIVAPCDYGFSPLSSFQAVNSPDAALAAIPEHQAEALLVKLCRELHLK